MQNVVTLFGLYGDTLKSSLTYVEEFTRAVKKLDKDKKTLPPIKYKKSSNSTSKRIKEFRKMNKY